MSAHLDLEVVPTAVLDSTVGQATHQIAGGVDPSGPPVEVQVEEALGVELRAIVVAVSDPRPPDQQLPDLPGRDELAFRIHDVALCIGDRSADRDPIGPPRHDVGGRPDGGLGRPVQVHDHRLRGQQLVELLHEVVRQRLAAEQHLAQAGQRSLVARQHRDHAGQRRRALQMRDPVSLDRPDQILAGRLLDSRAETLQLFDPGQMGDHDIRRHAEIDQTGHFVHAGAAQRLHEHGRSLDGSEQAGTVEVAFERKLEQLRRLVGIELLHRGGADLCGRATTIGAPGIRIAPHQAGRTLQIADHRLTNQGLHRLGALAQEGVHHHRHTTRRGVVTRRRSRLAVGGDLRRQVVDALSEHVCQHVRTDLSGTHEGLRAAGRGDPDRQHFLHRSREGLQADGIAFRIQRGELIATPERAHLLDLLEHQRLAIGVLVRRQDEVVRLPARRNSDARTPAGEPVDQRPLFGDAERGMQGQHDTPGTQMHAGGDGRECRAHHGRVRIGRPEVVEMPLGRPDRFEAVSIGESGRLQDEPVRIGIGAVHAAGKMEETERGPVRPIGIADRARPVHHHLEAARQGPQQLEHRDVERGARHCQPLPGTSDVDHLVHAREEVDHVGVRHPDSLRLPGGARCVDHVGEVLRTPRAVCRRVLEIGRRMERLGRADGDPGALEVLRVASLRDDQRDARVERTEPEPIDRVRRIER